MRQDELSFEIRLERRTTKSSSSGSIMRLVPVFIVETHNPDELQKKFVQKDNASVVQIRPIWLCRVVNYRTFEKRAPARFVMWFTGNILNRVTLNYARVTR